MGNKDIFDRIAAAYDTPERVQLAKVSADAIKDNLSDTQQKSAIDFGCGTGLVGLQLINAFRAVLFLDTSEKMLDIVDHKIAAHQIPNAATFCLDLEAALPCALKADIIFMAQVLLHIEDYASVLLKLYDVLNEAGQMLIVDFDRNEKIDSDLVHNGFHQELLREAMQRMGYRDIRSKTFYTGKEVFMGQDASLFLLDARK